MMRGGSKTFSVALPQDYGCSYWVRGEDAICHGASFQFKDPIHNRAQISRRPDLRMPLQKNVFLPSLLKVRLTMI